MMVRGFRLRKRAAVAPAVVPSVWIPAERFWACAKKSSRKLLGSQGGKGLRIVPGAIGRQKLGIVR